MITLKSKKPEDRKPAARSPYVEIDGVVYDVDDEFTAAFALAHVRLSAEQGLDAANVWLMREALGSTGYHAVTTFEDLTPEDLAGILGGLIDRVHKALQPGKSGSSGS